MTSTDLQSAPGAPVLPGTLRLGPVHLTVSDLDRSLAFYRDVVGLPARERRGATAALGAGDADVLVLVGEPGARRAGRAAGLYHVALLHPSRTELARAALRLAAARAPIQGASDHLVSEAIYLADPDGNGLELYADRPRDAWPAGGPGERVGMATEPLDIHGLLALAEGEAPRVAADPALRVGHVHLHVGDVGAAVRFYRDVLGLELMTTYPAAAFLAAGGYHHHVAVNEWRGHGVPPQPAGAVGLRHWTILLPQRSDLDAVQARLAAAGIDADARPDGVLVRDPAGNAALLGVSG
ncbi:MAG TPA: VOC family protein [Solirubrobacteraceae bacterium]|nr:VOC family protein [Solirubrobacteraceae bacterium]